MSFTFSKILKNWTGFTTVFKDNTLSKAVQFSCLNLTFFSFIAASAVVNVVYNIRGNVGLSDHRKDEGSEVIMLNVIDGLRKIAWVNVYIKTLWREWDGPGFGG